MADVLEDDVLETITEGAAEAVEAAGEALAAAGEALAETAGSRRGRKSFLGLILLIIIGVVVWKLLERRQSESEGS